MGQPLHTSTIHIQLLGAFRVSVGERVIEDDAWKLRKAAGLIKLLALAPGHRLHKEQLFDALWPHLAPAAAGNNLRRTLHYSRRSLEPDRTGSSYLHTQGEYIELSSPAGLVIDVEQLEQAAARARRSAVIEDYHAALALYGGELLPEDRYEDYAIARREIVHRLHLSLLLELGRLHERRQERRFSVVAYQRVAASDPMHEEAQAALMRLYALDGQRGQALQQYRLLAAALEDELGVAPDPATQRLHEEIRSGRFPGEADSGGPAPVRLPRTNLPHALTTFVGREAEMATVREMLAGYRLLTLTGAGGSGKTRLALEVARSLLEQYADGVWFVELAALSDAGLVAEAVIKGLGLKEQPGRSAATSLADYLQNRQLLLVLDNCEHLSDAVARLAHSLLRRAPRLTILATSRQPLEVLGEAVFAVPPLTLPGATWSSGELLAFEAIHLFMERARLTRPAFAPTPANSATVVQICRRLDGLPLAIELAAAALHTASLDEIAAGLDDRFALLTRGNRTALPRHQTLRAVIAWSYALLDEDERKLFKRLSLFAGSASLEAVETVCNRLGDLTFGVRDGVTSLLEKNLLRRHEGPDGELRSGMLETIQAYAREQLASSGEMKALAEAHARYYLGLAEAARDELSGPEQAIWLEQLEADHDNLRAALRWAESQGDAETGLRLAAALWRFWLMRSYFGEGREWCARVLGQASADSALVATVLKGAGAFSYRQGDYEEARAYFERALASARGLDDRQNIADLLNNLGLVSQAQGHYAQAQALYRESLALTRALGDVHGSGRTLNNLGLVALYQGEYAAARSRLAECLAIAREVGNKGTEDNALNNLGMLAIYEEGYGEARALNEERLALARQLGNKYGIASALHNLGYVASCLGDHAAAQALYEESLAIARELGDRGTMAFALQNMGGVAAQRREYDRAWGLYRQSLAIAADIGDRYLVARILEEAAGLSATQGAAAKAARFGGAAESLRAEIGAARPPAERATFEQEIAAARATVDERVWTAEWARGRLMTQEEALAEMG